MPFVHSSVKKYVEGHLSRCLSHPRHGIRRPFTIVYNKQWCFEHVASDGNKMIIGKPGIKFIVLQKTVVRNPIEGIPNLSYSVRTGFPVQFIPQASFIDERLKSALIDCRIRRNEKEEVKKELSLESTKLDRKMRDYAEVFASENWNWFQRYCDQWNFGNTSEFDPTAKRKRLEDKLGRALK